MGLDPSELAAILPPERRYERRARLWLDGPHEGWRAYDRVLGREVVLNIAHHWTGPVPLLRRARIAATLQHPCIPSVHDLGLIDDGRPFFTTPLIEATPLDVLLDGRGREDDRPSGSPPIRPLVRAMRDACRAVEHAHRRGLLHLDLYPGNLRIGPESQEVLLEGGWEPMGPRDEGEADLGRITGRPAYMSREQVVEGGAGVGPWTDVFGLGGLLHFLLCGVPPNHLPGKPGHVEVMRAVVDGRFELRRPAVIRPEIGLARREARALGRICLKALAAQPDERHPTAASLADELDDWLEGRSSSWWAGFRRR
jgi:serine/threonine protein kinase